MSILKKILRKAGLVNSKFVGSQTYWEQRYKAGGNSGSGSYNELAQFKADVLNEFVRENGIKNVIEFGCGDGNQLALFDFPQYTGLDVSATAVKWCKEKFASDPTKQFDLSNKAHIEPSTYDLSLSLDVIYHLVEDAVFENYMDQLFSASAKWVIVYSNNEERGDYSPHVKPRKFTSYVEANHASFQLIEHIPAPYPLDEYGPEKGSWSDFYIYEKTV